MEGKHEEFLYYVYDLLRSKVIQKVHVLCKQITNIYALEYAIQDCLQSVFTMYHFVSRGEQQHYSGEFFIVRNITKTRRYNIDPLKPHFYVIKLGFTGYTLFFLFLLKNIDCGYSLEPPRRGGSNVYPQSMF